MITIDDVKKIEIRAGKILEAVPIEGSEKLLKLTVDFDEESPRTILSGIAKYFPDGNGLAGITCGFVANLEPRPMMGLESQGMILAVSGENYFSLLKLGDDVPVGALVK
jgi:methionine--tRNA ligase beta chain